VQRLVGLRIPAATVVAAFEAEFLRDPSGRPVAEFEEDVLERSLAANDGAAGPAGGGRRFGGKRRRERATVESEEGGVLRGLAEGQKRGRALRAAAVGATADVVVNDDSDAPAAVVSCATGADKVSRQGSLSSYDSLAVAGAAASVALDVESSVESRAGVRAGALVPADVNPSVVGLLGTHLQTTADVLSASPLAAVAG